MFLHPPFMVYLSYRFPRPTLNVYLSYRFPHQSLTVYLSCRFLHPSLTVYLSYRFPRPTLTVYLSYRFLHLSLTVVIFVLSSRFPRPSLTVYLWPRCGRPRAPTSQNSPESTQSLTMRMRTQGSQCFSACTTPSTREVQLYYTNQFSLLVQFIIWK